MNPMITEAITIGAILGASGAVAWLAKVKFQPEIERNLAKTQAVEETIAPRSKRSKTH
jgi:hypothetical protein